MPTQAYTYGLFNDPEKKAESTPEYDYLFDEPFYTAYSLESAKKTRDEMNKSRRSDLLGTLPEGTLVVIKRALIITTDYEMIDE